MATSTSECSCALRHNKLAFNSIKKLNGVVRLYLKRRPLPSTPR